MLREQVHMGVGMRLEKTACERERVRVDKKQKASDVFRKKDD